MVPLSDAGILDLWALGCHQDPVDFALTLLAAALPGTSREALATWPLGDRDAGLFRLRANTFGPQIVAVARCPACETAHDVVFTAADLGFGEPGRPPPDSAPLTLAHAPFHITVRRPDSRDLAAARMCETDAAARRLLIGRCVVEARHGDAVIAPAALPEAVIAEVGRAIETADPRTDVRLVLTCRHCATAWEELFDVGAFLAEELAIQARRLIAEVDALARAYGWSEPEILAVPRIRRQLYLEQVRG